MFCSVECTYPMSQGVTVILTQTVISGSLFIDNSSYMIMNCRHQMVVVTDIHRATENRFFAGSDRFLVCKTDSVCIKCIFFGPRKTLCGSYTGPISWISRVSNC